ncbi:efflux RND transporter periplasmic adaptor subunit [Hamadaea sp. NPDC050747]|uniref:efflux RND transporter periplasmic adaptor subunit n=1 Tax=Hamadaea sp. NPDC050747 TaxID=3155789 RepID=UPI0033F76CC7
MLKRIFTALAVLAVTAACSNSGEQTETPGLTPRGTVVTTAKPTRQDLTNKVSLTGKVTVNPVFGLVAPVTGQVRYVTVSTPSSTPRKPTKVATVVAKGKSHVVNVPAGAIFTGRLADDRSTVQAGMPIASAKHVGYGIVADIDGAQAYKISGALSTVRAQITNGPGPFTCTVLGTIAALPAGVIPDPPAQQPDPSASPSAPPVVKEPQQNTTPSEPTGMRVVCIAPTSVKLINGATATIEVVTESATNALVLPVEAVAGGQGKGQVEVVRPDGTHETREVVLGLTDGKVIQIKSGLTEADTVMVPGPDLPPGQATGDQGGPGAVVTK